MKKGGAQRQHPHGCVLDKMLDREVHDSAVFLQIVQRTEKNVKTAAPTASREHQCIALCPCRLTAQWQISKARQSTRDAKAKQQLHIAPN